MTVDILGFLADPNLRPWYVATGGAVLGLGRYVAAQVTKTQGFKLEIDAQQGLGELENMVERDPERRRDNRLLRALSIGVPAGLGIEASIRHANPLYDLYAAEAAVDVFSGWAGYKLGSHIIPVAARTLQNGWRAIDIHQ